MLNFMYINCMNKALLFLLFIPLVSWGQNQVDTLDLSEYENKYELSKIINETSGVEFYNNFLYTFNDSGGKPELYKLNSSNGKIVQTIDIKEAINIDWEEITRNNDTLYIGDFGNNLGTRKDLTIYSIKIPQNNTNENISTTIINKLKFVYEDQMDFKNYGHLKTNFDCEAMIYYNNLLHLFSKRWGDNKTVHYILNPKINDSVQVAKKIESFDTECVITGADIYNKELYLVGYTKEGAAYLWKFMNFTDHHFFSGNSKKVLLGLTAAISQIEGIAVTENQIYITGEEMNYSLFKAPPILYIIDKNEL